jgi:hypothetical protein
MTPLQTISEALRKKGLALSPETWQVIKVALGALESERSSDRDGACPKCGPVGCAECGGTGRMSGYIERQSSPEAEEA